MTVINHLLFFDTFSHETSDITQLDLVQFPRAVQVSEVRVIPLGARVKADFPGGVRLGATNPSQFEIEFFVNDLSKRGAATFENIGSLQYTQHGNIRLEFEKKPPTDGLLLRGNYNTITLAVYGILTKVQRDPSPPKPQARTEIVPQPPPEKVNTNERIRDWLEDTKRKQHAYEINPSEEEPPQWETKAPTSPAEFEERKDWRSCSKEETDGREYEREKDDDKRWERIERTPFKRDGNSRDTEKDLRDSKLLHRTGAGGELHLMEEDEDDGGGAGGGGTGSVGEFSRIKRTLEEWDERRSEDRSDNRSLRRPRTPMESPLPPPPSDSPASDTAARGVSVVTTIPPPIPSDEMEAISDNEDIPDLPAEELQGPELEEEPIEEVEDEDQHQPHLGSIHPQPIEEVAEEAEGICEYEEIMSDEDDLPEYQYEEDYLVEEWEDWVKPFSPQDVVELPELIFISPPTEMSYQVETKLWSMCQNKNYIEEKIAIGNKLSIITLETPLPTLVLNKAMEGDLSQDVPEETGEVWVQAVEQACQILPKALVYLTNQKEVLETLYSWVDFGLDFEMAINQQQPVFKIRHMKAGIRLCSLLLQCSDDVTSSLLKRGVMEKLFTLNDQPYLALSIRLMILRAIDAVLNTPSGIRYLISGRSFENKSGYERTLELLSTLQQSRAKVAAAVLVRKAHLLEICEKLQMDVYDLIGFSSIFFSDDDGGGGRKDAPTSAPSQSPSQKVGEDEEDKEGGGGEARVKLEPSSPDDCHDDTPLNNGESDKLRDSPVWNVNLPSPLLQSIVSCLKEILRTYIFADQLLVQPVRWLPGSKQFQLPKHSENPYRHIYTVFHLSGILEAIAVLLSTPSTSQNPSLLSYIKTFLLHLTKNEHGLRYLAWDRKASLLIVRALLQFGGDESRVAPPCDGESLFHLGVHISTMLHIVHQLDCIASLGGVVKKRKVNAEDGSSETRELTESCEPDYSQAVVHFNTLESLLMTASGKDAVVAVLGRPRFTEILFPYLYVDPEEDILDVNPSKFACLGYAVDLITLTVKFQNDAKFLEAYAEKLQNIILAGDRINSKLEDWSKMCDILPWLALAKNPDIFTYDKLQSLVNIVQDNLDKLEKFPGELITALRILRYLTIPENPVGEFNSDDHNNELIEELKYKYATMQLFSSDLHTHLINLLSKLFGMYQQPFLHSSSFVCGSEGGYVVTLVQPTLALLENILSHIIQARNADFKDLTAVVPLVQVYILMQAFPSSSPYHATAQKLKQNVINILLGFTRVIYTTEGEEVLSKSLWTQMMSEIFKYLMSAPNAMVSVITLVTELLPLPLPIQTQIPLTREETLHAIRLRKLWSAHLYSLAPTLQELIHRLGLATHPLLTHSLRRMCVSLSDLSAPMALLVAKATLDLLLQTHRLDQRTWIKEEMRVVTVKEETKGVSSAHASQQTTRALNMLASLVSHAPTKAAVLHLLRGGAPTLASNSSKTDEKYSSLVSTWCGILSLPSKTKDQSQAHIGAKECLVMIFHYLLDYENAMQVNQDEIEQDENKGMGEFVLTGVPHKDVLLPFVEALVDVIRAPHSQPNIIRHSFRVISRLLEHNYGFFYVKSVLEKKKSCLFATLKNLSTNFTKENPEYLALLKDVLYLCQLLTYPDEGRTQVISAAELSLHLGWKNDNVDSNNSGMRSVNSQDRKDIEGAVKVKKEEEDKETPQEEKREEETNLERIHPLKVLEHLVVSEGSDEEEAEHLYDEISQLISLLEKEGTFGVIDSCDLEEPPAVGLESLQVLFASRIVWTFPTVEDDLHSLWFTLPSYEDLDEKDAVSVNLLETCRKYAGEFDLLGALHKLVNGQTSHSISPQKVPKTAPKYKPSATAIRPDRRGRPYVAPMRGRSFGRGMNIRSDPFRSRPPNTSRPPSLHVDDFVALESTGHQPTGPTGYNKISFGRGKEMGLRHGHVTRSINKMMLDSMRARGRVRGDNRGRFFHRPLFRGDGGRGIGRAIGMRRGLGWVFRGVDGAPRGNFRGAPMNPMPPRFLRGRPFGRVVPGMLLPGGPKERFPQKFIERGRRDVTGGRHLRGFR